MLMKYDGDKLSKELKSKRLIERDITLRQAALEMGVGFATLSRIENKHKPDIETMATVCDWIGQPMNLFFIRNGKLTQIINNQKNKKRSTKNK